LSLKPPDPLERLGHAETLALEKQLAREEGAIQLALRQDAFRHECEYALVRRLRLSDASFEYDPADPAGFRSGMARFGSDLGASDSGATLYELQAGEAVCPYHYEYGEEEWALVIEGNPSVRTPEGTERLEPLDLVFFPKGPEGAHQIRNEGDAPARILMWSTVVLPTATVYPDSDKVGVWTGNKNDDLLARRESAVEYFDGET
jgi:uncharacterized cupin superfamily protein